MFGPDRVYIVSSRLVRADRYIVNGRGSVRAVGSSLLSTSQRPKIPKRGRSVVDVKMPNTSATLFRFTAGEVNTATRVTAYHD